MVRIPTHRVPTHPGEMLKQEFLEPLNITQVTLAQSIGVSYQRINEIVNGKRGITAATALRLAKFLGMSPDFWLNLQLRWDLYYAQKKESADIEKIESLSYLSDRITKLFDVGTTYLGDTQSNRQLEVILRLLL